MILDLLTQTRIFRMISYHFGRYWNLFTFFLFFDNVEPYWTIFGKLLTISNNFGIFCVSSIIFFTVFWEDDLLGLNTFLIFMCQGPIVKVIWFFRSAQKTYLKDFFVRLVKVLAWHIYYFNIQYIYNAKKNYLTTEYVGL